MKQIRKPLGQGKKGKITMVAALFTAAAAITCSGIWFGAYSITNNISITVMNAKVPGFVLAVLVAYFGIRAIISVNKLSKEILKDSAFFSWDNFKRVKHSKSR